MWQHYLGLEIILQNLLTLFMVHRERAYVGHHLCQTVRLHSTQSQNSANNSIFVASWNVAAGNDDVGKEEIRIWSVLSYRALLPLEK